MTEPHHKTAALPQVVLIAAIALAVRLPHLGSATPTYDEFYHLLAARGWLHDGSFHIGAGHYTRVKLFTGMVAESLRLFGDTIAAGRVPALGAGTLWVAAVFLWTRQVAGDVAGWAAGLLLALDPGAVYLSQLVRFYTIQGLLVWVGAACVYRLIVDRPSPGRAALVATFGAAAWGFAAYFQITTLIALVGVGIWAVAVLARRLALVPAKPHSMPRWLALGGSVALLAAGFWLVRSGTAAVLWSGYTGTPTWAEGEQDLLRPGPRFYAWWLGARYPTLWALFPVALLLGVARFTQPGLFAATVFASAFVGVSLAGAKQERYIYFVMPFFFALWAMALATLLPALRAAAERAIAALGGLRLSPRGRARAGGALAALAVLFAVMANDAPRMTWRMVFPGTGERPYRLSDWTKALPQLRPLVDSADVVVASYILHSIYYLGRGDVALDRAQLSELRWENGHPVEFSIDRRTGRPAISSPESLQRLMACFGSGVVLVERFHLNRAHMIPAATTEFLLANTEEVPVPADSWVRAFRWHHPVPPNQAGCPPWRASSETPAGS